LELNFFKNFQIYKHVNYFNFNIFNFSKTNNLITFKNILNNKYQNRSFYLLTSGHNYKYNWLLQTSNFQKYFEVVEFESFNFNFIDFNFMGESSTEQNLLNIVEFKKKSSLFKKEFDYEFTILNRSALTKEDIFEPFKENITNKENIGDSPRYIEDFENFFFKNDFYDTIKTKSVDLKKKVKILFYNNRKLLRKILKIKANRQYKFNKITKRFNKTDSKSLLIGLECKLLNVLVRLNFFTNHSDCLFFIKNGFVSIDGFVMINPNYILKPHQIINLNLNKYFYFFYRSNLHDNINKLYKFNNKINKINIRRNLNTTTQPEYYHHWIKDCMYFNDDIPLNFEVDYLNMTITILYYSFDEYDLDYYNTKFINFYTNRLYNWKYII